MLASYEAAGVSARVLGNALLDAPGGRDAQTLMWFRRPIRAYLERHARMMVGA